MSFQLGASQDVNSTDPNTLLGGQVDTFGGFGSDSGGGGLLSGGVAQDSVPGSWVFGNQTNQNNFTGASSAGAGVPPPTPSSVTLPGGVSGYALPAPPGFPSPQLQPAALPNAQYGQMPSGGVPRGPGFSSAQGPAALATSTAVPLSAPAAPANPYTTPLGAANPLTREQAQPMNIAPGTDTPIAPRPPLQGSVSMNVPQGSPQAGGPPAQAPWAAQAHALMAGAGQMFQPVLDAAGRFFGGEPAAAAELQPRPASAGQPHAAIDPRTGRPMMVPPPPPNTPVMQPGIPMMDPRAVEQSAARANKAGGILGQQAIGDNYSQANEILRDFNKGMKSLIGALKAEGDKLKKPHLDAYNARFNTPINGLMGPGAGAQGATLLQYRDYLEVRNAELSNAINNTFSARTTPQFQQEVDATVRAMVPRIYGAAAMFANNGLPGGRETAQGMMDPMALRHQAIAQVNSSYMQRARFLDEERKANSAVISRLDTEHRQALEDLSKVDDQVIRMSADGVKAYQEAASTKIKLLADSNNEAAKQAEMKIRESEVHTQNERINMQTQAALDANKIAALKFAQESDERRAKVTESAAKDAAVKAEAQAKARTENLKTAGAIAAEVYKMAANIHAQFPDKDMKDVYEEADRLVRRYVQSEPEQQGVTNPSNVAHAAGVK
jgi:hypothetical protein